MIKAEALSGTAKKVHPDLPFAALCDMKVRGKVVVGVKPEPESLDGDAIYPAQSWPRRFEASIDRPPCQRFAKC